jgi:glycosyltransferase involved in cell wall biosynthesis
MTVREALDEVAVVIPSRDRWPLLRTAIATALAQEDVAVQVIVVDDGSTDPTPAELAALRDRRLRVLRNDRSQGVAAARNLALEHVTAPWVSFLDDDDVWAPAHLASLMRAVRGAEVPRERVGLVFSGHVDIDRDRRVTGVSPPDPAEDIREGLTRFNVVGGPSRVVLDTQAVREVGGFDPDFSILADWDLWARLVAEREAVRSPETLVGYMRHPGNMHIDVDKLLDEMTALKRKHGWDRGAERGPRPDDTMAFHVAATYRATGRRFRAARWYARSFRARGERRDLGRAVGVVLGERVIELSGMRQRTTVDDPEFARWLEQVNEAERATTSGLPAVPRLRSEALPTAG